MSRARKRIGEAVVRRDGEHRTECPDFGFPGAHIDIRVRWSPAAPEAMDHGRRRILQEKQ